VKIHVIYLLIYTVTIYRTTILLVAMCLFGLAVATTIVLSLISVYLPNRGAGLARCKFSNIILAKIFPVVFDYNYLNFTSDECRCLYFIVKYVPRHLYFLNISYIFSSDIMSNIICTNSF
jgi:hypothetical protein